MVWQVRSYASTLCTRKRSFKRQAPRKPSLNEIQKGAGHLDTHFSALNDGAVDISKAANFLTRKCLREDTEAFLVIHKCLLIKRRLMRAEGHLRTQFP